MVTAWYYLHTNGDLILKRTEPEADSGFVRRVWPLDLGNRLHAWRIILGALELGADRKRVLGLAEKWHVTVADLPRYLVEESYNRISKKELAEGLRKLVTEEWGLDFDEVMDHIASAPRGSHPDMREFSLRVVETLNRGDV